MTTLRSESRGPPATGGRELRRPARQHLPTSYGSGLDIKAPGVSADAHRVVLGAVVVDTTPYGVPIVAFTGVISVKGHTTDPDAVDAAICAALAP